MKEKSEKFNKITSNNEKYSLELKIKEQNILCMSLSFDNDNNQYEDFKLYEDIKEEQAYFKIVFKEITELISKDKVELIKLRNILIIVLFFL